MPELEPATTKTDSESYLEDNVFTNYTIEDYNKLKKDYNIFTSNNSNSTWNYKYK